MLGEDPLFFLDLLTQRDCLLVSLKDLKLAFEDLFLSVEAMITDDFVVRREQLHEKIVIKFRLTLSRGSSSDLCDSCPSSCQPDRTKALLCRLS